MEGRVARSRACHYPSTAPMPRYVDGFVIPVPRRNLDTYRRMSRRAGRIWREHGALAFHENVMDDVPDGVIPFTRAARAKRGEVVMFSFTVFRSRAHRDRVNAKVMVDPRILRMMKDHAMPFDAERMVYGGFRSIVDL